MRVCGVFRARGFGGVGSEQSSGAVDGLRSCRGVACSYTGLRDEFAAEISSVLLC